jgi:hypothetical protein
MTDLILSIRCCRLVLCRLGPATAARYFTHAGYTTLRLYNNQIYHRPTGLGVDVRVCVKRQFKPSPL